MDEAIEQGRGHVTERVGLLAAALQRLTDAVEQDRTQAAEVAGDYTPKQLQVSLSFVAFAVLNVKGDYTPMQLWV